MVKIIEKIRPAEKKDLTILIVDDHPLFRAGLRKIFDQTEYASSVFFEARNGREAIDIALYESVGLIFLDESMPELSGFDAAVRILVARPKINIIALTQFDEMPLIMNYFKIGAKGFLSKTVDAAQISEACSTVLAGNYYYHTRFDGQVRSWLSEGLRKGTPSIRFTEREVEVILHISKGKTNSQIASLLDLSQRTVETYRYDLIHKTQVANSADLLSFVYKNAIF